MSGQNKPIGFKINEEDNSAERNDLKKEEKKEKGTPAAFTRLIDFVKENFEPSTALSEGKFFTTQEIFEMLQEHYPSEGYTAENIYNALEKAGFKYTSPGEDLSFVWMLKRK